MKRMNRKILSSKAFLVVLALTSSIGNAGWQGREEFDQRVVKVSRGQSLKTLVHPFFSDVRAEDLSELTRHALGKADTLGERKGIFEEAYARVMKFEDFKEQLVQGVRLVETMVEFYSDEQKNISKKTVLPDMDLSTSSLVVGATSEELLGNMRTELMEVWNTAVTSLRALTGLREGIPSGGKENRVFFNKTRLQEMINMLDASRACLQDRLNTSAQDVAAYEEKLGATDEERGFLERVENALVSQGLAQKSQGTSAPLLGLGFVGGTPPDTMLPKNAEVVLGAVYYPAHRAAIELFYEHMQSLRVLMGLEKLEKGKERAEYGPPAFRGDGSSFDHSAAGFRTVQEESAMKDVRIDLLTRRLASQVGGASKDEEGDLAFYKAQFVGAIERVNATLARNAQYVQFVANQQREIERLKAELKAHEEALASSARSNASA